MFALAILAAIFRVSTRIHLRRKLLTDDYLLLFAVVTLIGSVGVLYWGIEALYLVEVLSVSPSVATGFLADSDDSGQKLIDGVGQFERTVYSFVSLNTNTIFM